MKKLNYSLVIIIIAVISSCSGKKSSEQVSNEPAAVSAAPQKPVTMGNETSLLLKDLKDNGDYVNSQNYPSLIKASVVHESLGSNILVIDIRNPEQFKAGHIKGAVNKKFSDLPEYFESGIKPFEYDKIVMVCNHGMSASYTTSLLRLMGYGNVYSMRWGMSSWNNDYAKEGWLKSVSGKYESQLETTLHEKTPGTSLPDLKTGFSTGPEIAQARFKAVFEEGLTNFAINANEVFADPSKYYIINLERKDKYDDGHIPGAFRYKPESTLGFPEEMASIPKDKTVVVYCGTGHNSAFATACLRLFGYDARTLRYGNNSFMYDKMVKEKARLSWLPFSSADVNDFEVVK